MTSYNVFSDQNGIKLNISNTKASGKSSNMSEVNNKYLNIIWLEKGVTWKIREKIINCMKIKVCLKSMRDRAKMALEAIL